MTEKTFVVDLKSPTPGLASALGLGDNEFLSVISTPDLDRDGEIIDPGALEPLPDKIVVEIDHASFTGERAGVRSVVGSGVPMYVGDDLLIRGTYASTPLAQEVRTLVNEGHVDKMSISLVKHAREVDADGVPHVTQGELLNVSFVTVPANDNAAVLASKGAATDEAETTETAPASGEGEHEVEGLVLALDRPDTIAPEHVDAWSEAVVAYAQGWTATGTEDPDGATSEEAAAAQAAADNEAALRQIQRDRAQAMVTMAQAQTPITGEQAQ